jgi:hypothetical protein
VTHAGSLALTGSGLVRIQWAPPGISALELA